MTVGLLSILLVGGLFLLLALGAEIFVAMGVMAALAIMLLLGQSLDQFIYTAWSSTNSFTLTAVPLFIFMGTMLAGSGIIRTLFRGSDKLLAFLPGGMAASSLGASGIFGAISGSSIASTAAMGTAVLPEMIRLGYKPKLALGSIVMGGTLSVLIPPSVILIVYGAYQGISVPQLFAGGLIPGIILGLLYLVTVIIRVKLDPSLVPEQVKYTWKEKLSGIVDVLPGMAVIGLVLGVIFGGVMTPTEAAALGAFLSMAVALAYGRLNYTTLKEAALAAVRVIAMIVPLFVMVNVLGYVFSYLEVIDAAVSIMTSLPLGKYGILAVLFLTYIILGTFMEGLSIMLLSLPFVVPIMGDLGFSLLWFGVVLVVVNELGLVTPPFGMNLFALHGVAPEHSIFTSARSAVPFYPAVLILLALCVAFPEIILWLAYAIY